mmetsp:Transcript_19154/g.30462  ORF Transcript_19154/g.30462 Transcript_19154/m.30462 type:complete len:129 (-) Transcript_19154:61-447(-)
MRKIESLSLIRRLKTLKRQHQLTERKRRSQYSRNHLRKKENGMKVGMKVSTIDGRRGIIRFLGKLHCARGIWVGMELFSGTGSNSGVVKGKKYFDCMPKKGIMVKLEKIKNPKTVEKVDEDGVEEIEL